MQEIMLKISAQGKKAIFLSWTVCRRAHIRNGV